MNEFPYFHDNNLSPTANKKINLEIIKYAGIYILKKIDIAQHNNQKIFTIPLNSLDEHLEPILDDLMFKDLITIDTKQACYKISKKADDFIEGIIKEIENIIEIYQEYDIKTRIKMMNSKGIDIARVRFLWGLYDGEFDDLESWQIEREIPEEKQLRSWQQIITNKYFYDILYADMEI